MSVSADDDKILYRINHLSIIDKNIAQSHGPHTPGAFKGTRLFGGHTIAQSYLAFKKLYPKTQVIKLDTIFIAPGNVIDSMEFCVDEKTLEFGCTKIQIIQNTKLIATSMIRFSRNLSSHLLIDPKWNIFPKNINPPETYQVLSLGTFKNGLFELRPILPDMKDDEETKNIDLCQSWAQLNSALKSW
uniref:Uncharacterized protein n=1 Tax=Panagrolaimus superbus TaxID=310955 RepID=A0A914YGK6_9BILA